MWKYGHNIIEIHNSVMQDWQYSREYSPTFRLYVKNIRNIPYNIVSPA